MKKRLPDKHWFRAKQYGWGWYPATWQGWLVTFGYLAVFTAVLVAFEMRVPEHHDLPDIGIFLGVELVLIVALLYVCNRTGERPRWRWGGKDVRRRK